MVGSLEFIKSETISSSVSSISVTDCFSAKYDVYKVIIEGVSKADTTGRNLDMQYIDSTDTVVTSAIYDYARLLMLTYASFSESKFTNQTILAGVGGADGTSGYATNSILYVFNPFDSASYTFNTNQVSLSQSTGSYGEKQIGVLKQTSSITGFKISVASSENVNSGTVSVYGVK